MADDKVGTPEEERKAAEASFAASEAPAKADQEEPVKEIKETLEPAPEVVADPWDGVQEVVRKSHEATVGQLQNVTQQLGNFSKTFNEHRADFGRIAASLQRLEAGKEAAKVVKDAPTQDQIAEASKDLEKWKTLKDEWGDWGAGIDARMTERLAAERAEVLKNIPAFDQAAIDEAIKQAEARAEQKTQAAERRAREFARVDKKYDSWEDDILTPDRKNFTPEFAAWKQVQPLEIQALASSDSSRDAIKMLDAFYEHRKAEDSRLKTKQRLESAIPAKGTQGQRPPPQNDRDAAEKAFASV